MGKLKLLVFASVCWVAPVAAQQVGADNGPSGCQFASKSKAARQAAGPVSLSEGVPTEGLLFDAGERSAVLVP